MLHRGKIAQLVSLVFIATVVASSVASGAQSRWQPIALERVVVGVSDIIPGPDGPAVVAVPVTNKSQADIWVALKLRPPAPATETSSNARVVAGQDVVIHLPQDKFTKGDYVITVAVFADSASSDTLESGSTIGQLTDKDVKALEKWLKANTLPMTFKHIEKVDKVTTGTTLTSMFGAPKGDGTLTLESTGVTYAKKKESIVIPASAIHDVRLNKSDPKQPWVVIDYELNGERKSISFKPNVYTGSASAEEIAQAIRGLVIRQPTAR